MHVRPRGAESGARRGRDTGRTRDSRRHARPPLPLPLMLLMLHLMIPLLYFLLPLPLPLPPLLRLVLLQHLPLARALVLGVRPPPPALQQPAPNQPRARVSQYQQRGVAR